MVDSDRDAVLSSMLEELPRLRDDTFWPSFPEWMEELKLLPAGERLRGQFKRYVHRRGIPETRESLVAEWHHLKGLRQLQADYKVLADFLSTHAKETDLLQGSLTSVLLNAFFLGQKCPPMKRTSPATGKRKTKKQKRLEIVLPLLAKAEAAYPDAGPYSLAKNIKDEVNRQLGEDAVEEDTIRRDIDRIFKAREAVRQDIRS
jgi:hypothetical protein